MLFQKRIYTNTNSLQIIKEKLNFNASTQTVVRLTILLLCQIPIPSPSYIHVNLWMDHFLFSNTFCKCGSTYIRIFMFVDSMAVKWFVVNEELCVSFSNCSDSKRLSIDICSITTLQSDLTKY